ncbi:MAG: hypothetical protein IPJ74_00935 [Saprospiraceae bacterium]|nr:hypothetical protein [Saprospiraceae bacterium]
MKYLIACTILLLSLSSCRENSQTDDHVMEMGIKIGDQILFRTKLQWNGPDSLAQQGSIHFDSLANHPHITVLEEEVHPAFMAHQERLQKAFSSENEMDNKIPQSDRGGAEAAQAAVEATKLVWDIIKDARPVVNVDGDFTSILNDLDTNWVNYENAKVFKSGELSIYTKNAIGVVNTDVRFSVGGTYGASYGGKNIDISKGGNYIPNIHVAFSNVSAGATWNINATASVSNISNIGTVADVNAYTIVKITLSYYGWFQSFTKTFLIDVSGKDGITDITLPPDGI